MSLGSHDSSRDTTRPAPKARPCLWLSLASASVPSGLHGRGQGTTDASPPSPPTPHILATSFSAPLLARRLLYHAHLAPVSRCGSEVAFRKPTLPSPQTPQRLGTPRPLSVLLGCVLDAVDGSRALCTPSTGCTTEPHPQSL